MNMKKTLIISDKKPKGSRKRDTTTININNKQRKRPKRRRVRNRRNNPNRLNYPSIYGVVDRENYVSTAKMLDTLFVADRGISRGIAFGSTPTALLTQKQSFEVVVPAGSYAVLMTQVNSLQSGAHHYFGGNGTTAGAINNGSSINITNATTFPSGLPGLLPWAQPVSGPFVASNPSTSWRVVSFTMVITPDTNLLNQGGWYQVIHCNQMAYGTFAPAAGGAAAYVGPATYLDYLQYPMLSTFKGTQTAIYHQLPSSDEILLNATNGTNTSFESSGPIVVFQSPTQASNATTYKITCQYGIEYAASDTARKIVQQYLSDVNPSAEYEVNQFAAANWDKFVIAEKCEWEKAILDMPDVTHDYVLKGGYNPAPSLTNIIKPKYFSNLPTRRGSRSVISRIETDSHTGSFETDNRQVGKAQKYVYKPTNRYAATWADDYGYA